MAHPDRRLALVVGPGRSGTSSLSGILERLGWHVPDQVASDETNPAGFFEPQWVVDLHTEHLRRAGVATLDTDPEVLAHLADAVPHDAVRDRLAEWLEQHLADHPRVLVKDPRLLWFYEDWTAAAASCGADVVSLVMVREPSEVVASRRTYYDVVPATAAAGWVNAVTLTERMTRGRPRALVDYRSLLADWRGVLEPADAALRLGLAEAGADAAGLVDRFVDPALQRMPRGWDDLPVPLALSALADEVHAALVATAAAGGDEAAGRAALDQLRAHYTTLHDDAAAVAKHRARRAVRAARRKARETARAASAGTPRGDRAGAR